MEEKEGKIEGLFSVILVFDKEGKGQWKRRKEERKETADEENSGHLLDGNGMLSTTKQQRQQPKRLIADVFKQCC